MRSFQEILNESKKTYSFKVGLAGELPEGIAERLKTVLNRYGVISITAGKKTPIQECPLEFPNLKNTEVTYYEVELQYPTTNGVLQEYLSQCCSMPASHIRVRNVNDPLVVDQETDKENLDTPYEPLLTKEHIDATSAQKDVGENRIMDLLKELETARKERTVATGSPLPENGS
jgi:hypothetical protein